MEWVETTGKTVDEAKDKALDQLGVHIEDAEFEVLEEPKAGLFGRVRGEARVRARVRPAQVRQKLDRRDRKRSDKNAKGDKAEKAPKGDTDTTGEAAGDSAEPTRGGQSRGKGKGDGQRSSQPRAPKAAPAKKAAEPKTEKSADTE